MKKALLTGEELRERAEELGVIITIDDSNEASGDYKMFRAVASDVEIQRRVVDAERYLQTQRIWIVAVISASASVISAFAAWCAVYLKY